MRYLGNKESLLGDIWDLLEKHELLQRGYVFFDAFCGMGSVSNRFKEIFRLVSNDILHCCTTYTRGRLVASQCKFNSLGLDPFEALNSDSSFKEGFFYKNYSPGGSDRMYFSEENAGRIDFARQQIEDWHKNELLSDDEYNYLLACLLEALSGVANTAGVYGAFLKHWDHRAKKRMSIEPLIQNDSTCAFAPSFLNGKIEDVVADIDCDIIYLDPPYTQNQYGTQYHILETLILNDEPSLSKVTGSRPVTPMRSGWSRDLYAHILFDKVIAKTHARHIIFSYSDDGFMSKDFIESTMKRYGKEETFVCKDISYKEYENVKSVRNKNHQEFLFYIEKKTADSVVIESPLNYTGSKAKSINDIRAILPNDCPVFVDAFGGGFNVGVNVSSEKVVYNDINPFVSKLIESFKTNDTFQYLRKVQKLISSYNLSVGEKEPYYALREHYNSVPWDRRNPIELYTLVLFGFQQQIRFNTSYEFNNPIGSRYFNDKLLSKFISFARVIKEKNVTFRNGSFQLLRDYLEPEVFFYFDPPYLNTTGVYNDGKRGFEGWTCEHENRLCTFIDELNEVGGRFAFSYSINVNGIENERIRQWAERNDYRIIDIAEPQGRYHDRNEVIIINY